MRVADLQLYVDICRNLRIFHSFLDMTGIVTEKSPAFSHASCEVFCIVLRTRRTRFLVNSELMLHKPLYLLRTQTVQPHTIFPVFRLLCTFFSDSRVPLSYFRLLCSLFPSSPDAIELSYMGYYTAPGGIVGVKILENFFDGCVRTVA